MSVTQQKSSGNYGLIEKFYKWSFEVLKYIFITFLRVTQCKKQKEIHLILKTRRYQINRDKRER